MRALPCMPNEESSSQQLVPIRPPQASAVALPPAALQMVPYQQSAHVGGIELPGATFNRAQIGGNTKYIEKADNIIKQQNNTFIHVQSSSLETEYGGSEQQDSEDSNVVNLPSSIYLFLDDPLASGIVFRGEKKFAGKVMPLAIKSLTFDEKRYAEARNLRKAGQHRNIVDIIDCDQYYQGKFPYIYIAMEMCQEENLQDRVEKMSEGDFSSEVAISQAKQLISGLAHIHECGIRHGDLKPRNILFSLEGDDLKIADFGVSKELKNGRTTHKTSTLMRGTDGYRAPETYNSNKMSRKADMFSAGLVAYFIFSKGCHAFGNDQDEWVINIKRNQNRDLGRLLLRNEDGDYALELLEKLLEHDPEKRPRAKKVLETWSFPNSDKFKGEGENKKAASNVQESASEESQVPKGNELQLLFFNRLSFKLNLMNFDPSKSNEMIKAEIEEVKMIEGPDVLTEMIRESCSTVAVRRCVFALLWRKAVYKLDFKKKSRGWEGVRPTKYGHGRKPAAAVLEEQIFVCGGGWGGNGECYTGYWTMELATNKAEKYDVSTNQWTEIASMKHATRDNSVVAAKGYIFSIGGQDENSDTLAVVERYDPRADKWEQMAPMKDPRYAAAATTLDSKIYVLGGCGTGNSIESYNIKKDSWTTLKQELNSHYHYFKAYSCAEKLFAVGGQRRAMEVIDLKTESQTTILLKDHIRSFDPMLTLFYNPCRRISTDCAALKRD